MCGDAFMHECIVLDATGVATAFVYAVVSLPPPFTMVVLCRHGAGVFTYSPRERARYTGQWEHGCPP